MDSNACGLFSANVLQGTGEPLCLQQTIFLATQPFAPIIALPFCPYDLLSWQSTLLDINTKERPTMHLNLE